jgi:acetylornithine deacetylase/succinyl-diaminopimelate desuccinylase-like protein
MSVTTRLGAEALRHLQALLRFDTSNPPGNELPAARYVAGQLQAAGFETAVIDLGDNRGSCVGRLRGDGSRRPLLLMSHLDVVPVEADRWSQPPFDGRIVDGEIYGRGTLDMKQATAMHLAVARAIAGERLPLRRDLIVAATCGEEDGGPGLRYNGIHRLTTERPELIDAEYGLSEGGGWAYVIDGQPFYTCQVGERGGWVVELVARGRPGHAAVPHDEHAVIRLAEALVRLGRQSPPLRVTDAARAFFEGAAARSSGATAALLHGLLEPARHAAALAALPVDPATRLIFHAMLHSTATPTIVQAGYKSNVIPSEARATLSGRPLPGVDEATLAAELRAIVGDEVEIVSHGFRAGFEFPHQTPLFAALAAALARYEPGATLLPALVPFGTDAQHLDRRRLIVYGLTPMRPRSGPSWFELMHGHDERLALADLDFGAAVIADAVRLLNDLPPA